MSNLEIVGGPVAALLRELIALHGPSTPLKSPCCAAHSTYLCLHFHTDSHLWSQPKHRTLFIFYVLFPYISKIIKGERRKASRTRMFLLAFHFFCLPPSSRTTGKHFYNLYYPSTY